MTTRTLGDLLPYLPLTSAASSEAAFDPAHVIITHVTGDSRAVQPGSLFVAAPGGSVDGHAFIPAALAQGATAILGSRSPAELAALEIDIPLGRPYVQVTDSRLALARAAAAFHGFPSRAMTTVGITGTDGKTTTAAILEAILTAASRTASAPQGQVGVITTVGARIQGQEQDTGFHVTTPDAPAVQAFLAEMQAAGCRYAIVESTSHGLDQQRVAAVEYDVAAVTNITHEHLDYHGSREAYVAAKARLFRMLFASSPKPNVARFAVLNADDAGSFDALRAVIDKEASRSTVAVTTYAYGIPAPSQGAALKSRFNAIATDIDYRPERTDFRLVWRKDLGRKPDADALDFSLSTRLIGEYNVQNILCAATIALGLGVGHQAIQAGVSGLDGVIGRMERIHGGQDFLAIVDFAHSPASLERALLTLRALLDRPAGHEAPRRLIAVFGSAGLRDHAKRRLMGQVSGRLADFTVVTAEDPRTEELAAINAEIVAGLREYVADDAFIVVPDRAAAIQYAVDMAQPGDIVCAFGKGHERSMCFGETEYPWSDQQAMSDALARRQSAAR